MQSVFERTPDTCLFLRLCKEERQIFLKLLLLTMSATFVKIYFKICCCLKRGEVAREGVSFFCAKPKRKYFLLTHKPKSRINIYFLVYLAMWNSRNTLQKIWGHQLYFNIECIWSNNKNFSSSNLPGLYGIISDL